MPLCMVQTIVMKPFLPFFFTNLGKTHELEKNFNGLNTDFLTGSVHTGVQGSIPNQAPV